MKKRYIFITSLLLTFGFALPIKVNAADFSSGDGTKDNPYIISNRDELDNVRNYCGEAHKDKYFKIDTGSKTLDMGESNFDPICDAKVWYENGNKDSGKLSQNYTEQFWGHFDGNNIEIVNLNINSNKQGVGLFSFIYNAEIENVIIGKNSSIISASDREVDGTGSIAGFSRYSTIKNIKNHANIEGNDTTGGIAGYSCDSTLENVRNYGNVTGNKCVGGITCVLFDGKLSKSINTGNILSKYNGDSYEKIRTGGIVGQIQRTTINEVINKGNVEGKIIGGIIGSCSATSSIQDVVNEGSIKSYENTGSGIVWTVKGCLITNVANYNRNLNFSIQDDISNYEHEGDNITRNAYSINGKKLINEPKIKQENVKSYTEEELKNQENYMGFDFVNVWTMKNGKATLKFFADEEKKIEEQNKKEDKITIKYNDITIDIENFLYQDRTFVNLDDFCDNSKICKLKKDNDIYIITKNLETTGDEITSEIKGNTKYTYTVTHKQGTKEYTPYIIIGNRKELRDDVTNQISDVKSCPEDVENYKCDEDHLYVPVRFLTQSLGLRVEWDGENNIVNIKNNFVETFLNKYDVATTKTKDCRGDLCTVKKQGLYTKLNKGETYYLTVIDKDKKENIAFSRFYSFYDNVKEQKQGNDIIYKNGVFSIRRAELTVDEPTTNDSVFNKNIAQVIMYEIKTSDEGYKESDYNAGGYPIIINNVFSCADC